MTRLEFELQQTRWKKFLRKYRLKQREMASILGYEDLDRISLTIGNCKTTRRAFPFYLAKIMDFMEWYEKNIGEDKLDRIREILEE